MLYFSPRTVTDWNSLPCNSVRSKPSMDSFKTALRRLSGITSMSSLSHAWWHSSSNRCTPSAWYSLKITNG